MQFTIDNEAIFTVVHAIFLLVNVIVICFMLKTQRNIVIMYKQIKDDRTLAIEKYIEKLDNRLEKHHSLYAAASNTILTAAENQHVNLFDIFMKLKNSIEPICSDTMRTLNACRLAIYLFHNGNFSTHGIQFFKMSCICENIARGNGIRERITNQSNMPVNLFDDMIDKLIKNGVYIIINNRDLSSSHKIFVSAPKITYSMAVSIFDNENNILGFVLIEMDQNYNKDAADKEIQILKDLSTQLVPVLAYSNYTLVKSDAAN